MKSSDKAIADFLTRGVERVYPTRDELEKAIESGKKIRVYLGVDPTGPSLHIGHAIPLRKLAELQKLGHEVILLIGDFTAMIGDPTDKSAARKQLTREEVLENCANYKLQASRILDFEGPNAAKFLFNSKWLGEMSFGDVVELASHFTVQQMMERDMFEKRIYGLSVDVRSNSSLTPQTYEIVCPNCRKKNKILVAPGATGLFTIPKCEFCGAGDFIKPVYLHEFLYPLMQGYDSVAMDVDLEIGGNDQTFNMLAGRTLMKEMKGKEKFVLTTKLLADATGKKMGKTEGNMIALADAPEEMYGKVMSWTDGMILNGFELCTDVPLEQIVEIGESMEAGENPVQFKHALAYEIVKAFLGTNAAEGAREHFESVHKGGEIPEDAPEFVLEGSMSLADTLVESGLVPSKSEARRQIEQGGVKVDGVVVDDMMMKVKAGQTLQKGKRHFVRLV